VIVARLAWKKIAGLENRKRKGRVLIFVTPRGLIYAARQRRRFEVHLCGKNQAVYTIDSGSVERDGHGGLKVRSGHGVVLEHISVSRLRSWCIVGPDGVSIDWDMSEGDDERLR
jgi:hypothetical protein